MNKNIFNLTQQRFGRISPAPKRGTHSASWSWTSVLLATLILFSCHPRKPRTDSTQPLSTNVTEFAVDSLRILLQPSDHEVVSVALFIEGGVTNYPADKAGLEQLTLLALLQGDGSDDWRRKLREAHADFQVHCTEDFSVIGFTCLRDEMDDIWPLFAQSFTQPSFTWESLEEGRALLLSNIYQQKLSHSALTRKLLREHFLPGNYQAKGTEGEPDFLRGIEVDQLREYHESLLLNRTKMTLVVSGNLDYEDVSEWVMDEWNDIPAKPAQPLVSSAALPLTAGVRMHWLDGPETRVTGVLKAPPSGSREEAALLLALDLAVSRSVETLEAQSNFPSLAQARLSHTRWPFALVEVQGRDASLIASTLIAELRSMLDDGISATELRQSQAHLLTREMLALESSESRALCLGRDAIVHHWEDSFRHRRHLQQVTAEEVTSALRRYAPIRTWAIVGDTLALDRQVFSQTSGQ